MEDRRQKDEEEERRWRELEASPHEKKLREQMDMIKRVVETSAPRSNVSTDDGGARSGSGRDKVVLMKLV